MNKTTLKNMLGRVLDAFSNFQKKDKKIKGKIKKVKLKIAKKKTDQKIEEVRKEISQM